VHAVPVPIPKTRHVAAAEALKSRLQYPARRTGGRHVTVESFTIPATPQCLTAIGAAGAPETAFGGAEGWSGASKRPVASGRGGDQRAKCRSHGSKTTRKMPRYIACVLARLQECGSAGRSRTSSPNCSDVGPVEQSDEYHDAVAIWSTMEASVAACSSRPAVDDLNAVRSA